MRAGEIGRKWGELYTGKFRETGKHPYFAANNSCKGNISAGNGPQNPNKAIPENCFAVAVTRNEIT